MSIVKRDDVPDLNFSIQLFYVVLYCLLFIIIVLKLSTYSSTVATVWLMILYRSPCIKYINKKIRQTLDKITNDNSVVKDCTSCDIGTV